MIRLVVFLLLGFAAGDAFAADALSGNLGARLCDGMVLSRDTKAECHRYVTDTLKSYSDVNRYQMANNVCSVFAFNLGAMSAGYFCLKNAVEIMDDEDLALKLAACSERGSYPNKAECLLPAFKAKGWPKPAEKPERQSSLPTGGYSS